MAFVSITRVHLASKWSIPLFIAYSFAAARQARRTRGFHGGWLGNDADYAFWTCTVWDTVQTMRGFRNSGVHLKAMPKLLRWADEASFAHWEQPDADATTPEMAYARLAEGGMLSKVAQPSARHQAGIRVGLAAPRLGRRLSPQMRAPSRPGR